MSKFKWPIWKMSGMRTISLIAFALGLGMLMVLIFPPWIWILVVALSLISWGCKCFIKR